MTTYCEDCDNATQKKQSSFQWLCMAVPREPKQTFIRKNEVTEPYERCHKINDGNCLLFERMKDVSTETE